MNKPNNSTSDVMDKTMKPNKQKTDWESIEKIVEDIMQCGFEVAMGGDMYKDEEENKKLQEEKYNECVAVFTHKISRLLKTQRQQLISEIEGIVGEDEKEGWGVSSASRVYGRNQLRQEIREGLKQWK